MPDGGRVAGRAGQVITADALDRNDFPLGDITAYGRSHVDSPGYGLAVLDRR